MTDPDPNALIGSVVAGFRCDSVIGAGAAGAVYRAVRLEDGLPVALKMLHDQHGANVEVVERFRREMRATGRIDHPNTARVVDFGADDGRIFLALELLEGRTLEDALIDDAPFEPTLVVHLGRQIARGLGAAHAAGITHRDLKPENILLVSAPDGAEIVKIVDFGLALFEEGSDAARLTAYGARVGTPHYMAPEYIQDPTHVDPRCDLYSLGVILYQMITGQTPFRDRNPYGVLRKHVSQPAPDPTLAAPSCPPWLRDLILDLLAKAPDDRPASAEAVTARLDSGPTVAPVVRMHAAPVAAPTQAPAAMRYATASLAVVAAGLLALAVARSLGLV